MEVNVALVIACLALPCGGAFIKGRRPVRGSGGSWPLEGDYPGAVPRCLLQMHAPNCKAKFIHAGEFVLLREGLSQPAQLACASACFPFWGLYLPNKHSPTPYFAARACAQETRSRAFSRTSRGHDHMHILDHALVHFVHITRIHLMKMLVLPH